MVSLAGMGPPAIPVFPPALTGPARPSANPLNRVVPDNLIDFKEWLKRAALRPAASADKVAGCVNKKLVKNELYSDDVTGTMLSGEFKPHTCD